MKPCPNCGSSQIFRGTDTYKLKHEYCDDCGLTGPRDDPDGKKWDSLPRRGELTITQTLETVSTTTDREAWREYAAAAIAGGHALDRMGTVEEVFEDVIVTADEMLAAEKSRFDGGA
jgi:hypothetical protein